MKKEPLKVGGGKKAAEKDRAQNKQTQKKHARMQGRTFFHPYQDSQFSSQSLNQLKEKGQSARTQDRPRTNLLE